MPVAGFSSEKLERCKVGRSDADMRTKRRASGKPNERGANQMDKTTGEYDFTRLETVVFGVGKVEALGRELSRRGAKRTLIVTGKTLGQSKLLGRVKSAAGNALAGVFTGAAPAVRWQTVTELVAEARRVGADAMVSFGGGSPIDTVKNAAWQLMGGRGGEILHIA